MLRLRTSTGLSLLALAIGIAGTGWLSTLTDRWQGQPARGIAAEPRSMPRKHSRHPVRRSGAVSVVMHRRHAPDRLPVGALPSVQAAVASAPVELIPVSTPSDNSRPWYQLQGHLDGRVVLHLTIDGSGRVITADMRESSGDPILDDHAMRSVHHWRFAIPAGHPDGLSGDLPMRFASGRRDVASAS